MMSKINYVFILCKSYYNTMADCGKEKMYIIYKILRNNIENYTNHLINCLM